MAEVKVLLQLILKGHVRRLSDLTHFESTTGAATTSVATTPPTIILLAILTTASDAIKATSLPILLHFELGVVLWCTLPLLKSTLLSFTTLRLIHGHVRRSTLTWLSPSILLLLLLVLLFLFFVFFCLLLLGNNGRVLLLNFFLRFLWSFRLRTLNDCEVFNMINFEDNTANYIFVPLNFIFAVASPFCSKRANI